MNDMDKTVLKICNKQLTDDIFVDEALLAGLYTEGIFQKGMIETIRSQPTATEKTYKLLELLSKRGPMALTTFITAIEESYSWLAELLISTRKTVEQRAEEARNRKSSNNDRGASHDERNLGQGSSPLDQEVTMFANGQDMDAILGRLSSLEGDNKALKSELHILQKDNITLHKDVLAVQQENVSLRKKVEGLEENEKRVTKENAKLQRMAKSMKDEFNISANEVKDQLKQLQKVRTVLNKSLVEAHSDSDLGTHVKDLAQRTDGIEEILTRNSQSVTILSIFLSGPLLLKQRLNIMDSGVNVRTVGCYDIAARCLNPKISGRYALNVVFRQYGDGQLRMFGKGDGGMDVHLGTSDCQTDISSTMRVLQLNKGQKFWIELCLEKGNATLRWCNVNCWHFCD